MQTSDPFQMGFIHGYLIADTIEKLTDEVLWPMIRFAGIYVGDFSGKKLMSNLKQVHIPKPFHEEIRGIFEGMQRACRERSTTMRITFEDLLLAHKFTDIYKSIGCQNRFGCSSSHVFGCTTVLLRGPDNRVLGGRTLDWPAFIKGGTHMILRKHMLPDGTYLTNHALPGIVHTHTAFNQQGLVAIINELGTTSCEGIPYGLFTRKIVESTKSLSEARQMIDEALKSPELSPASSYHLTLMDSEGHGSNFQFYPEGITSTGKRTYLERALGDQPQDALVITNHAVDSFGGDIANSEADSTSHVRMKDVLAVLAKRQAPTLDTLQQCLKAANVQDTIAAATLYYDQANNIQSRYVHGGNFAANNL